MAIGLICAWGAAGCKPAAAPVPPPGPQPTTAPAHTGAVPPPPAGTDIMATVSGQPIYMDQLHRPLVEAHGLRIAEMLVADKLVALEAERRNIAVTDEEVAAESERLLDVVFGGLSQTPLNPDQRQRALETLLKKRGLTRSLWNSTVRRRALLRKMVEPQVVVTEPMLKAEYARWYGEKAEVRHIQVPTLDEAEKILALLKEGADFAELARKRSTHVANAERGGLMPTFTRQSTEVPQAIRDAAFALKVGQLSGIVQTGNSFHVLKLIKRIEPAAEKYEQVKDSLRESVREDLVNRLQLQLLTELRGKADVEYINPTLRREVRASQVASRP